MSGASLPPSTTPTPPAQPSGQGRAPVAVADVTIESLPPKLASLARTVTVTGQVVAQEDGTATIRTPAGDVVVKTPVQLPTDRPVQLQIPGGQAAAQPQKAVALTPQPAATPSQGAGQTAAPTAPQVATPPPGRPSTSGAQPGAAPAGQGASQAASQVASQAASQAGAQPAGQSPVDGTGAADGQTLPTLRPNIAIRATVVALPPMVTPPPPSQGQGDGQALPGRSVTTPQGQTTSPAPASGMPTVSIPAPSPLPGATPPAGPLPPQGAGTAATATPAPVVQGGTTPPVPGATPGAPAGPTATPSAAAADGPAAPPPGTPAGPRPGPVPGGTADDLLRVPVPARATSRPDGGQPAGGGTPDARAPGAGAPNTTAPPTSAPSGAPSSKVVGGPPQAVLSARLIAQTVATDVASGPPLAARLPAAAAPPSVAAPPASAGPAIPTGAAQTGTAQPTAPPPIQLAPGQAVTVRLVPTPGPQPQGAGGIPSTPSPSAPVDATIQSEGEAASPGAARPALSGTIAGSTAGGQTVVTTPAGTLVLQARTSLPPGTPVQLALDPAAERATLAASALDILHGRDWPVLKDIMALLAAADPALARQVANNAIPQANRRLTTNLIFLLSAIRGGDAGGWLGDAAAGTLEGAGRRDLLARLSEDFRAMARQASEPLPDGWTVFPMPFGEPDRPGRLQFYLRSGGDRDGDGRGDGRRESRRFLIELELTRLGAMQLDGLVWPGHLDLILRTRDLLPQDLKADIGAIFRGSLEAVGFAGTLGFQTGAHAWVTVKRGGGRVSA